MIPARLREQPLQNILLILILSTSGLVLLITAVVLTINEASTYRSTEKEELHAIADIVAHNVKADILFNDAKAAGETLQSLEVVPQIFAAAVIKKDLSIFAFYQGTPPRILSDSEVLAARGKGSLGMKAFEQITRESETSWDWDFDIDVIRPITINGENLGWVILQSGIGRLIKRLAVFLLVILLALSASLYLAYLLSRRFSEYISAPIQSLIKTMRTVSVSEDYSLRVAAAGAPEINLITAGLNNMLDQIQARDATLKQHRETLEQQVGTRTKELTDANAKLGDVVAELTVARDAANAANLAKTKFLSNMSHEIRTPLHGVLGITELLMKTDLSAKQQDYVEMLNKSGSILLQLVDDILDFSKIEAGKIQLEHIPFSPEKTVETILSTQDREAQRKGLFLRSHVSGQVPARLAGDPTRLGQILLNLVSNALKFTEQGGVTLSVEMNRQTPETAELLFQVTDTGIGMSDENKKIIFNSFTQADASTTRRFGGSGLGLSIARKLVNLMGGELSVESQENAGSTFRFTAVFGLVAGDVQEDPAMQEFDVIARVPCYHVAVLIAEDNAVNQKVVSSLLEHFGCSVTLVEDGAKAVEAYISSRYDLVLMDCQMPVMDGYEAALKIREHEQAAGAGRPRVPIIALTGNVSEKDRERCFSVGMDAFLGKPFSIDRLISVLDQWLPGNPDRLHQPAPGRPAASEEPSGASQAVLDRKALDNIRSVHQQDGEKILVQIINVYLQDSPELMGRLDTAVKQEDAEAMRRVAHSLKTGSANLGAVNLSALCRQMEELGRSGSLQGAGSLMARIAEEFSRARRALLAVAGEAEA